MSRPEPFPCELCGGTGEGTRLDVDLWRLDCPGCSGTGGVLLDANEQSLFASMPLTADELYEAMCEAEDEGAL